MTKPKWPSDIPEDVFMKLARSRVNKMSHENRHDGLSEEWDWIVAHTASGENIDLPDGWERYFYIKAKYDGLLHLNREGRSLQEIGSARIAYENANKKERAEYERLKKKFEGEP